MLTGITNTKPTVRYPPSRRYVLPFLLHFLKPASTRTLWGHTLLKYQKYSEMGSRRGTFGYKSETKCFPVCAIQVRCIFCVPCSPLSYFFSPVHSSISFQCIASLSMHCLAKTICKKKYSWCIESLEFSPEKDNGWDITYSVISALRYLR